MPCHIVDTIIRGEAAGRAIVQTLQPDAPAIRRAAEHDYEAFADRELEDRTRFGLPPVRRMTRILIRHPGELEALRLGEELVTRLRSIEGPGTELRGPVPCAIARIAGRYRVQIEILAEGAGASTRFIAAAREGGRPTVLLGVKSLVCTGSGWFGISPQRPPLVPHVAPTC